MSYQLTFPTTHTTRRRRWMTIAIVSSLFTVGVVATSASGLLNPNRQAAAATVQPHLLGAGTFAIMMITSIPGETTSVGHKNGIDVLSFSWGTTSASHMLTGVGLTPGRVTFNSLTILKRIDKASPLLFLSSASGANLGTVTLYLESPTLDGKIFDAGSIALANTRVASFQFSSNTSAEVPTETITLNFTKIVYTYSAPSSGGPVSAGWDIAKNKIV